MLTVLGQPFVKRFALCYQTVVCLVCLSVLSVTLVYCGQTVGWIKMKLGMQVGLGPDHIVLNGDPAPLPKKGAEPPPQFSAHVHCGQMVGCIKKSLGIEVGLDPDYTVLDLDTAALPQKGTEPPPNFRPISIVAKRLDASRCHSVW